MSSDFKFTFIIAYRDNAQRLQNLTRVLEWVNSFDKVEVIIVEQDNYSKICNLKLKAKHIFTKSNTLFNKSKAFNIGLKQATSDIIVFGDSDLIMEHISFLNGLDSLNDFEMCNPYFKSIDLNQEESSLPFERIFEIERLGRAETDVHKFALPICGGICMFRKEAIKKIGGWNEDFVGWGGEDDFQDIKVKNFLSRTDLDSKCFHLYHEAVVPDKKHYKKNTDILKQVLKMDVTELQQIIDKQVLNLNK